MKMNRNWWQINIRSEFFLQFLFLWTLHFLNAILNEWVDDMAKFIETELNFKIKLAPLFEILNTPLLYARYTGYTENSM